MGALQFVDVPGYAALILRRTYSDLTKPGALMDRARDWLGGTAARFADKEHTWTFPSGASLTFGNLETEKDRFMYQSSELNYVGFDELTQFTLGQYQYLFSRVRRPKSGPLAQIPLRVRSASNPGNSGHAWVQRRFILPWKLWKEGKGPKPARSFHPAVLDDLAEIMDIGAYEEQLKELNPVEYAQLRYGNWDIKPEGRMFNPAWFKIIRRAEIPAEIDWVRFWDLAATEPKPGTDPDYTAGALMGRDPRTGLFYLANIFRFRRSPEATEKAIRKTAERDGYEVPIVIEQEPGSSGKPVYTGCMILMGDGSYKELSEVVVNDQVVTHTGKAQKVLAVHEQGELPTLRITTHSGREVTVAYDHPILTPDGWKDAIDLHTGDIIGLISRPQRLQSSNHRIAEEFRLAGYFVGDGACGPTMKTPRALHPKKSTSKMWTEPSCLSTICCYDPVELKDIQHCVDRLGFSMHEEPNRPHNYAITGGRHGRTAGIKAWLREVGLAGKMSHTKRVPDWVFTAPTTMVGEFLGAYFACDGTLDLEKRTAEFYSVSRDLLCDVQHLLLRFGVASRLALKNGQYNSERHISWRLTLLNSDDAAHRFVSRVPIHHSSKASMLSEIGQHCTRFDEPFLPDKVDKIEESDLLPCRCLTVEEDHTFCVEDIVVHNSLVDVWARRVLHGFSVRGLRATGSKITRATPLTSAAEKGHLLLLEGIWNEAFLDEAELFPDPGNHDDQVDAVSGAHMVLTRTEGSHIIAVPLSLTEPSLWRI